MWLFCWNKEKVEINNTTETKKKVYKTFHPIRHTNRNLKTFPKCQLSLQNGQSTKFSFSIFD